jgi:hypothetical protein
LIRPFQCGAVARPANLIWYIYFALIIFLKSSVTSAYLQPVITPPISGSYAVPVNFAGHLVKPVYITAVSNFFAFGELCDPVFNIFHAVCLSLFDVFIIQHLPDNVKRLINELKIYFTDF